MRRAHPKPVPTEIAEQPRAGILLPLPLAGAYDYKLPRECNAPRGTLVAAPLGNRTVMGAVWGAAEGTVGDNRLKIAEPLEGGPRLPEKLCDFIDWVADYTLSPPGAILAMALRSRGAFGPEAYRTAYVKGDIIPAKLSEAQPARAGHRRRWPGAFRTGLGRGCECVHRHGARTDRGGRADYDTIAGVRTVCHS